MIVFFNFLLQLSSGKNKAYLEVLFFAIDKCKRNTINQNMLFDRIAQRWMLEIRKKQWFNCLLLSNVAANREYYSFFFFRVIYFLNYSKIKLQ